LDLRQRIALLEVMDYSCEDRKVRDICICGGADAVGDPIASARRLDSDSTNAINKTARGSRIRCKLCVDALEKFTV
jgi:hypothetical protein